jgi:hypothetical protein
MMNQTNNTPISDEFKKDRELSLVELQTHICELEKVKSAISYEERKINALIRSLEDIIDNSPDCNEYTSNMKTSVLFGNPDQSLDEIMVMLKNVSDTLVNQYSQLIKSLENGFSQSVLSEQDPENVDEFPTIHGIQKIPIYVIHDDIYTLIQLIHRYTHFEYFKVYPFFSLDTAFEQMSSESRGGVLISANLVRRDPQQVMNSFHDKNITMPIIVLDTKQTEIGTICSEIFENYRSIHQECTQSELLEVFLSGLIGQSLQNLPSVSHHQIK